MTKIKVEFSDTLYGWSHGKAPRGRGYWGFEFKGQEFWAYGTLTEAKKKCVEEVKRLAIDGCVRVNIMP